MLRNVCACAHGQKLRNYCYQRMRGALVPIAVRPLGFSLDLHAQ